MNAKATTAKTAAAATAVEATPCLCGKYEVVLEEFDTPNGPDYTAETTGCNETTGNEFAPGHDAKLKSLLIRAGVAGHAVRYGSLTTTADKAAQGFGFAHMVLAGIEKGKAKVAAKADRSAAKAERRAAAPRKGKAAPAAATGERVVAVATPAEAPAAEVAETVRVKVGRWEYDAVIVDGDAHYTNAKQLPAVAVKGTYKLVG